MLLAGVEALDDLADLLGVLVPDSPALRFRVWTARLLTLPVMRSIAFSSRYSRISPSLILM